MNKKYVKNKIVITAFLAVMLLISSSSISADLKKISEITDEKTPIVVETSAGLAPKNTLDNPIFPASLGGHTEINDNSRQPINSISRYDTMWGYIVNSDTYDEGPCYFYLEDPGTIEYFKETVSDDFLSGGTGTSDERWLAVEYGNGVLWEIDWQTGDMWSIGGGGVSLNGLTWDPIYNRLYGASGSGLYEIDPDTGDQEFIGAFGIGVDEMISIAANGIGTIYGWDLGDKLWTIDLETGEATEIGSLGIDLNYAQDGGFDWETNTLWLTAYTVSPNNGCYLYECDIDTAECTLIDQFEGNSQITASFLSFGMCCLDSDVGVKKILKPEDSSHAVPEMDMEILVKNYGNSTDTFDAQMQVGTYEDGAIILDEDFSGPFPPEGWSTDFWSQSDTNYACGEAPEARAYKYDQYNGGQYYDNYIMTKSLDCSNIEAVKLGFKLTMDAYYPQYCYLNLKYREDSNSSWKDITPWYNPLPGDINCEQYWITINGDPYLGEEFQVKWEFNGYYYYYNNIYLDDVIIQEYNCLNEYYEIIYDITLSPGEETIVVFPKWTPSYWQDPDYENTWQELRVKACTLLNGDDNPGNDCKQKNIDLYFPWFYDISLISIDSPPDWRSYPARTFDVEATIKNVGQYAQCCIPIDISIGESVTLDTLLDENAWITVPPEGWYDEHKDISESYGWEKFYSDYSGGESPEARLRYSKAEPDHVLYSYAIDASDYLALQLEFKSFIDHYQGQGLYALEAGYSTDNETWITTWHEEPGHNEEYHVRCDIEGGHETLYIGFWITGNPDYFNYWYIDDISVKIMDLIIEYSDSACQADDLEPGESRTFAFDDWTPDYLQYETTAWGVPYIADALIYVTQDQNPDNNMITEYFELDYWHDASVSHITSPSDGNNQRDLCWYNGEPDGRNALLGSMYQGQSNIVIDDFENNENWVLGGGHFRFVWYDGYSTGNLETVKVYFFEETDDCEPSMEEYAELEVIWFDEYATGDYYFGRPEIAVDVEFEEVELPPGKWWVGFQPEGETDDRAYLLTAEDYGCSVMGDLPYLGYQRWSSSRYIWGTDYDLAWGLYCYGCCGPRCIYIQPGTENIEAVVANYGTFPELDLVCNAQIWEYITDPEYGTKVFEEDVTDIDLDTPLGGEEQLDFGQYNFQMEGRYGLFLSIPDDNDDFPKNNEIRHGICVDNTNPVSEHTLKPLEPDGEDGWYVSDVKVTLEANDPYVKDVSSGVAEVKYRINDGPVETLHGYGGTFLLTQEHDGKDVLVEYWAIDNVGNEETPHNTFTIDMDQTNPTVELDYEVTGGNQIKGWDLLFTATATDKTSGMSRVEFFFNGLYQETVVGPGPTYEWGFTYHGGLNLIIRADGYDIAGNMESDDIRDPTVTNYQNNQQQSQSHTSSYFMNKPLQGLIVIPGGFR
jgi:hypothetical protein